MLLLGFDNSPAQNSTSTFLDTCITIERDAIHLSDAFLDSRFPQTNFGNYPDFISYDWTFNGDEGLGSSLIRFDLSSLPENAIIYKAVISLYYNPTSTGAGGQAGDNESLLEVVTTPWVDSTVTWFTAPGVTITNAVFLPTSSLPDQDYPDIDITGIVRNWHEGVYPNYGLMLEILNKWLYNSMKFCSSEYPDTLKRPKIDICYVRDIGTGIEGGSSPTRDLLIMPNPSDGKFNVFLPGKDRKDRFHFTVCDITGNILLSEVFNGLTETNPGIIDLTAFGEGVYILNVRNERASYTRRLIVE